MRLENESGHPSHMSYKEYKNKLVKNKKQTLMMFISIFFVLLLVFLGFARIMSPDVDISIGDENVATELDANNTEYNRSGNVDDRLKALQEEDADQVTSSETATEDGGLVKIPEKTVKTEQVPQEEDAITLEEPVKKQPATTHQDAATTAPAPAAVHPTTTAAQTSHAVQATTSTTARVVVGFYNTQAQASVAKGILQDAGLGVTPHIRAMGSGYTLQVGAYSSKESANNLANKLLMNNYPARVIVEGN